MLTALVMPETRNPRLRGYHAVYQMGETNHCPGCGRSQWIIGRITAECAFCLTAIPLDDQRRTERARVIGFSTRPGIGPLE